MASHCRNDGSAIINPGLQRQSARSAAYLIVGSSLVFTATADAALSGRSGSTQLQSNTGGSVDVICPQMGAAGGTQGALPADQQFLFETCRSLIQTANDIDGSGDSTFSLGLTNDQLNAALQQVAGEEALTARTFATETSAGQVANVGTRLAELRGGGRGFSVAGLQFDRDIAALYADALDAGWHGRAGGGASADGSPGRLGGFINGVISTGEKDSTDGENGFDFDSWGITAGIDYRFDDNLVLGVAAGYSKVDSDYDESVTVAGGGVELDSYSINVYGTWYRDNFYADALVAYSSNDYDLERDIGFGGTSATAEADTDGEAWSAGAGVGYDFNRDALRYGPYARVSWTQLDVDGYTESGALGLNLDVEDQDADSLTSVLGVQAAYAISHSRGVLVPQARLEWIHEFSNDADDVITRYVSDFTGTPLVTRSDDSDADYGALSLGMTALTQGGMQGFIQYETWLGLEDITEHIFTVGGRYAF